MAKLIDWIRQASVQILDPKREERIAWYTRQVAAHLKQQKRDFDFDAVVSSLEIQERDIPLVQERTYELALNQAWRDRSLSEQEKRGLDWVAGSVSLSTHQRKQIDLRAGLQVFQTVLADSIADGVIQPSELEHLTLIATCIGSSVRELMRQYFSDWGEGFLRSLFLKMADDGEISDRDWSNLLSAAEAIGFTRDEMLESIASQAERFVEHVLLDAKADGRLSEHEARSLSFLLERLSLSPKFRRYIEEELQDLRLLTDIGAGRLPSLVLTEVGLRAGEIVHFAAIADFVETKHLKSGPRTTCHRGRALVTDYRLIFESPTKTFELNHRRVAGLRSVGRALEVRTTARGTGKYDFGKESRLGFLIYEAAIRKANQTLVEQLDGLPARHIPRDIRQRVYQRYGGCCAECGSKQYIEYDHIIPVAKGGSNSEQNVQLLCRACNLKKSDNI